MNERNFKFQLKFFSTVHVSLRRKKSHELVKGKSVVCLLLLESLEVLWPHPFAPATSRVWCNGGKEHFKRNKAIEICLISLCILKLFFVI